MAEGTHRPRSEQALGRVTKLDDMHAEVDTIRKGMIPMQLERFGSLALADPLAYRLYLAGNVSCMLDQPNHLFWCR
jgi:hypothetical protein